MKMKEEIEKLFKNARVVTFEQIKPFIGEDSEQFWTGIESEEEESMLDFLQRVGFDIISCRREGEKLQTEIYVNFDKFQTDFPKPEPIFSVSKPMKQFPNLDIIKSVAYDLAKQLCKGRVDLCKYGDDGFRLYFLGGLSVDYNKLRSTVLGQLAKEMKLEFEDEK